MESFSRWRVAKERDALLTLSRGGLDSAVLRRQHSHRELELHFMVHGQLAQMADGERVEVPEGTLVVIPPGFQHLTLVHEAEVEHYMCQLRPRLVRRVLPPALYKQWMSGERWLHRRVSPRMHRRLTRALREAVPEQTALGASLWNAFAAQLLALQAIAYEEGDHGRVQEITHPAVIRAVELLRGPDAPDGMADLARRCAASESHLSRTFAAQVGMSITDFRNRCRLARYLDLYERRPDDNLMNLAIDAGFGSYPQFHRVFTQLMDETPADYRRRGSASSGEN